MVSDRLIHRILASEASAQKSRVLFEELGSLPESEALSRLASHPLLTDGERRRIAAANDAPLLDALAQGAKILHGDLLPWRLHELPGTPIAVMTHGEAEVLEQPTLGIVGTRGATAYGKACALKFAEAAARAGVTVISGGALGIDAAAHKGALEAGGKTVAVLAAGVDNVYPAVHAGLFQQIHQSGCLVSQFAAGTKPGDYRFLVRNALVAALSDAVLVVEAPKRSGAMRTAHAAVEYGKEVFVVPANIDLMNFSGSFALIREGATLVTHPDDVLESMGIEPIAAAPAPTIEGPAAKILAVLSTTPKPTEKIVAESGMETAEVLSELTMLELDGLILRDAGGYTIRP